MREGGSLGSNPFDWFLFHSFKVKGVDYLKLLDLIFCYCELCLMNQECIRLCHLHWVDFLRYKLVHDLTIAVSPCLRCKLTLENPHVHFKILGRRFQI